MLVGGLEGLYFIVLDEFWVRIDGYFFDGWLLGIIFVSLLVFEISILFVFAALHISHPLVCLLL